ncbi:MAG TPA: glycosyltransferase family 2 protein, partial [Kofleriaceae bacterium]
MAASPRVSVVIPAFQSRWLDQALDSVRAQTFPSYEIVVVDDGSPVPLQPAKRDDVVVVRQTNTGPGGARNRGVAVARGELIAFLDSDDRWRPQMLERQVAWMDANPTAVLVFTGVHLDGRNPRDESYAHLLDPRSGRLPYGVLFEENMIPTSCAMIRRQAYLRTPGMSLHRRLGEDYALWLRIALLGEVGFIDEVLLDRRVHTGSLMAGASRDATIEADLEIYEELFAEHPELRGAFAPRALARVEFQRGYECLATARWAGARQAFARSL